MVRSMFYQKPPADDDPPPLRTSSYACNDTILEVKLGRVGGGVSIGEEGITQGAFA